MSWKSPEKVQIYGQAAAVRIPLQAAVKVYQTPRKIRFVVNVACAFTECWALVWLVKIWLHLYHYKLHIPRWHSMCGGLVVIYNANCCVGTRRLSVQTLNGSILF